MSGTIYDSIYPLTITADRYTGAYSGGVFTAWNLEPIDVPTEPFEDDVGCAEYWGENNPICGKGDTPSEACANLYSILLGGDGNAD